MIQGCFAACLLWSVTESCLRALSGEAGIVECTFVASSMTSLPFFAR
jgi:hypothetical protein